MEQLIENRLSSPYVPLTLEKLILKQQRVEDLLNIAWIPLEVGTFGQLQALVRKKSLVVGKTLIQNGGLPSDIQVFTKITSIGENFGLLNVQVGAYPQGSRVNYFTPT